MLKIMSDKNTDLGWPDAFKAPNSYSANPKFVAMFVYLSEKLKR